MKIRKKTIEKILFQAAMANEIIYRMRLCQGQSLKARCEEGANRFWEIYEPQSERETIMCALDMDIETIAGMDRTDIVAK